METFCTKQEINPQELTLSKGLKFLTEKRKKGCRQHGVLSKTKITLSAVINNEGMPFGQLNTLMQFMKGVLDVDLPTPKIGHFKASTGAIISQQFPGKQPNKQQKFNLKNCNIDCFKWKEDFICHFIGVSKSFYFRSRMVSVCSSLARKITKTKQN